MPRSARDPLVGATLAGRFHVKRLLASGGMAKVYVARDGEQGPRVAVKVLARPRKNRERLLALMRREAAALTTLDHPNIVRHVDHGPTVDGGYYIAMELVEGVSLTTWMREHGQQPLDCIGLLLQLCSALRHAHRKGLVHRDLKASNVLVTRSGQGSASVKLIDFGVVQVDGEEVAGEEHLLGGVHTSSPEQIRGDPVDHRSDIYSFGVLAWRLTTGRYPYHSKLPAEVLAMHLHADVPELPAGSGLPEGIGPVLTRCLAKDPADRYPDVKVLMDDLSAVLDVPTAFFVLPVEPPRPAARRAPGVPLVLALLALVAALVAAALLLG